MLVYIWRLNSESYHPPPLFSQTCPTIGTEANFWAPGQPNYRSDNYQGCLAMTSDRDNYKIADELCSNNVGRYYICEKGRCF